MVDCECGHRTVECTINAPAHDRMRDMILAYDPILCLTRVRFPGLESFGISAGSGQVLSRHPARLAEWSERVFVGIVPQLHCLESRQKKEENNL